MFIFLLCYDRTVCDLVAPPPPSLPPPVSVRRNARGRFIASLILFFFFAILYVEVFSLTKWHSAETRNQNYTSIGTALVMLAFMTSG